jgi:hypothetical protein
VHGKKGLKPFGMFHVFDANGIEILYPVYCDTATGEVERIVTPLREGESGRAKTVTEFHSAPLRMVRVFKGRKP